MIVASVAPMLASVDTSYSATLTYVYDAEVIGFNDFSDFQTVDGISRGDGASFTIRVDTQAVSSNPSRPDLGSYSGLSLSLTIASRTWTVSSPIVRVFNEFDNRGSFQDIFSSFGLVSVGPSVETRNPARIDFSLFDDDRSFFDSGELPVFAPDGRDAESQRVLLSFEQGGVPFRAPSIVFGVQEGSVSIAPIPLPTGLPLIVTGVAGLGILRMRRRKRPFQQEYSERALEGPKHVAEVYASLPVGAVKAIEQRDRNG